MTDAEVKQRYRELASTDWERLEELHLEARRRSRAGSDIRDGFPASTALGGAGASDEGEYDRTSGAVLGRYVEDADRPGHLIEWAPRDKVNERRVHLDTTLDRAWSEIYDLERLVASVEIKREYVPDPPVCESCLRAGFRLDADARLGWTDVGGRLPHKMWLNQHCYDIVRRKGRLPTVESLQLWQRGKQRERA